MTLSRLVGNDANTNSAWYQQIQSVMDGSGATWNASAQTNAQNSKVQAMFRCPDVSASKGTNTPTARVARPGDPSLSCARAGGITPARAHDPVIHRRRAGAVVL